MGKTERFINIINTLTRNPAASAGELAEKLQVSERSVYRYLSELKRYGYLAHSTRDQETGTSVRVLRSLTFTATEALAVAAACQSFLSEGLPFCHEIEEALRKIKTAISSLDEKRTFARLETRFTYLTQNLRDYTPWMDDLNKIRNCIRQNRSIVAVYDSHASGEKERAMDPYDLFWNNGNMYLAAYCHNNKCMRSFKINRFSSVKETPALFERDLQFNLRDFIGQSWRVFRGSEEIVVKICVYPPATRYFLESSYHDSQEIQEHPNGKITCTLKTYNTPEFKSWLLSWGSQVEVLEPTDLREEIKQELLESLGKYGDD
jgi:predicted DNA-binding transcriptional regulator YafY